MGSRLRTVQAWLVDAIKRRAVARLHRKRAGEALLLQIYLWAEEGIEVEGLAELRRVPAPEWLEAQFERHLADEARHATMLRRRLRALGAEPSGAARVDPLSRFKLARLRRLGWRAAGAFRRGAVVPLLAIAFRMEGMGVRVLGRHVDVLRALPRPEGDGAEAPTTLALLETILADERAHVAACASALDRLLDDTERPALEALIRQIDAVDRAFGVTGALAMLALSFVPRRRPAGARNRPAANPGQQAPW